ncbi:MAG: sugar phosphate isomerase/epimerase [Deltaproteobacteria bacterium]|nr:sugar phosphate isomerase/epimerase [Deltaproteobacteria bacterium]
MKFGMNLLLWTTDATTEASLPLLERLKAMGFDGVEVPVFDLQPDRFERLGRRLDEIGLLRTAVTVRGVADNPISADETVRAAGVAKTKLALQCCQALGAPLLVGPVYAALGVFSGTPATTDEWRWGVDGVAAVMDEAERCGVDVAIEYLNRFEIYLINCVADALRFVRDVNHPRCKLMLDTFHGHIEEKDLGEALRACASALCHMHMSESDRSTPGSGQLHWGKVFAALKSLRYDGWLTIEAFGQALPELVAATKIWRPMYRDEDGLAREGLAFLKRSWATAPEAL